MKKMKIRKMGKEKKTTMIKEKMKKMMNLNKNKKVLIWILTSIYMIKIRIKISSFPVPFSVLIVYMQDFTME